MPESVRSRLRRLLFATFPPYRTLVTGFAEIRDRLAAIEAAQASTAVAIHDLSNVEPEAPIDERQFTIRVQRGVYHWTLTPEDFARFAFSDGDILQVRPDSEASKLPHIWGNLCIPCADGSSIRVPPTYRIHRYKGFRIPSHLIALTGGPAEQLEETGAAHIANFQRHVGIEAGMRIVEVGCGIGRDAFQLFDILGASGDYIGIDVTPDSIRWCTDNITRRDRRFTFHHFDAFNELYNPFGRGTSMDFAMPVADGSVDRIILSSVFTHLLEDEILHYMKEFRRVLKPGGLVYASFFLHTAEALEAAKTKGNTAWVAKFDLPLGNGLFANDPDYPRGAVALTDEAARRLIATAGLRLDRPYLKGWWSGLHESAEDGQDVMILGV